MFAATYTPTFAMYCEVPIVDIVVVPSKTIVMVGEVFTVTISMTKGAPVNMNISFGDVAGTGIIVPVFGETLFF
jgi:hypothetical protein